MLFYALGKKVKTHLKFTKKIEDLAPKNSIQHTFKADSKTVTVQQYFEAKGIKLK